MSVNADDQLHIYVVNVGQADTSVIVSPTGQVIVIDAKGPDKLLQLLRDLGINDTIEHLVITHPHSDHFSGANRLAQEFTIEEATMAPFWHEFGMGPPTYRRLMGRLEDQNANCHFLSGYTRWYPDGALMDDPHDDDPMVNPDAPYLELLGPTNGLVRMLEEANVFDTNHLSIMCRMSWRRFRMIFTGDAQMENWAFFDNERLLEDKCQVLKAAHHGSSNGTQWERLNRLSPRLVVVSSAPEHGHGLPDLVGAAVFAKYDAYNDYDDHEPERVVALTSDTGTVHIAVNEAGNRSVERYDEEPAQRVDLNSPIALDWSTNPSDWQGLLGVRVEQLGID